MVEVQLHIMLHIDLVQNILVLWGKPDGGVEVGGSGVVGRAKAHER